MFRGVPQTDEPQRRGSRAAGRCATFATHRNKFRAGALLLGLLSTVAFATSAFGAQASIGLGSATSFSVLAGSTITNTGSTTMSGDLGLSPGSSVTGAPQVLGQTHVDDAVAIGAKNALTTAFNDAASRPTSGSAGTDLSGQVFTPGVRTASSSLLLSSGTVTLDAQGNPEAVFIFQVGSTLTTGSNTTVQLINGAQACHVFWEIGSSATLGTGTRFVGTLMAAESITANTAATIQGRLLAKTAAVTLETNTITTARCAEGSAGTGTSTTTTTSTPTSTSPGATAPVTAPAQRQAAQLRAAKQRRILRARRAARRRRRVREAARRRSQARPALPTQRGGFTG